jgi:hypothetical protein
MPSVTTEWPPWQEFTFTKSVAEALEKDPNYINTKKSIIAEYGEENLRKSWLKTCEALKSVTKELETSGNEVMPILAIQDILADTVPSSTKDEIRKRGAFVVRQVVPQKETEGMFKELKDYVSRPGNKEKITGWPIATPNILRLYNSPTQNKLRSHGNQVKLMRWINNLWTWEEGDEELSAEPLIYADAVRIRPPQQPFLGLGPVRFLLPTPSQEDKRKLIESEAHRCRLPLSLGRPLLPKNLSPHFRGYP